MELNSIVMKCIKTNDGIHDILANEKVMFMTALWVTYVTIF